MCWTTPPKLPLCSGPGFSPLWLCLLLPLNLALPYKLFSSLHALQVLDVTGQPQWKCQASLPQVLRFIFEELLHCLPWKKLYLVCSSSPAKSQWLRPSKESGRCVSWETPTWYLPSWNAMVEAERTKPNDKNILVLLKPGGVETQTGQFYCTISRTHYGRRSRSEGRLESSVWWLRSSGLWWFTAGLRISEVKMENWTNRTCKWVGLHGTVNN